MAASDVLRGLVASIVDRRFVQCTEAGTRIREDVLEAQRLEDVHHEVRSGAIAGLNVDGGYRTAFGLLGRRCRNRARLGLLGIGSQGFRNQRRGASGRAFQKITTANRSFLGFHRDTSRLYYTARSRARLQRAAQRKTAIPAAADT